MAKKLGTKGRLLPIVLALSALVIAVNSRRPTLQPLPAPLPRRPLLSGPAKRKKWTQIIILLILLVAVGSLDLTLALKAGDVASAAVGATAAGIGGVLQMIADTERMGLLKENWRPGTKVTGNICVALGGVALLAAAWMAFYKSLHP